MSSDDERIEPLRRRSSTQSVQRVDANAVDDATDRYLDNHHDMLTSGVLDTRRRATTFSMSMFAGKKEKKKIKKQNNNFFFLSR
jgi:hypothetical protein